MAFDSKTAETNKAVTRRFMEEFKNEHIFAVVDELFFATGSRPLTG